MSVLLYRLGRFCYRSRRLVAALWVAALVLLGVGSAIFAEPAVTSFSLPGTESQEALDLLKDRFPDAPSDGAVARIVFIDDGGITTPEVQAEVRAVLADVSSIGQVAAVADPYASGMVSDDTTTALAEVTFSVPFAEIDDENREAVLDVVKDAGTDALQVEAGGDALEPAPAVGGELIGLAVAAGVLIITFGSLLAAGMPLATGITGVMAGVLGITIAGGFVDLGATTPILALMLGLAVGIDYALFIVSRFRHELRSGRAGDDAIGRALGTAGSAVVFAGLTVVIALAGLTVVNIGLLTEMGLAAAATVAVTVLVALTLLPALLGFVGPRILVRRPKTRPLATPGSGHPTHPTHPTHSEGSTLGSRWIRSVTRHPGVVVAVVMVGLLVAITPILGLRLGLPDQGTYAQDTTQRRAYDAIAQAFGSGVNGPLLVVVDAASAPDPDAAVAAIRSATGVTHGVAKVSQAQWNQDHDTAVLSVTPSSGPNSEDTSGVVERLRDRVDAIAHQFDADLTVTGNTALLIDFTDKMSGALLPYLLLVIGLSFLLLMAVFRSVLVPLKATLGFLLTLGVTFGCLVAVFQWGWLEWAGIEPTDTISPVLPLLIIGMVFGLAMDYEVFLVSRMREEYVHGAGPTAAVTMGFKHGARVVAAAALIMISVFGGFILGEAADLAQLGVALAIAVGVDAFIVRMTLVPAVLTLVGERAWWLPRWLDHLLPNLDVEGERLNHTLAAAELVTEPSPSQP
ncbi:MMPL family transporter [Nocardioides endophyticus]|uniref:MMPL family transporter n=1 Tax=Nocardioides endophyticus TaxID=1353775 RepID=A0ABP8Y8R5_9ACTN